MFDSNEDWYKIWRKTDLYFLKWHEEFCKFLFTSWKIDFILESKMVELNKNKQKFKTTRSTKCSVKTLFYQNFLDMFHRVIVLKVWENFQESCKVM